MDSRAKRSLWRLIEAEHEVLAAALIQAKEQGKVEIRITGYPAKTQRWIDRALQRCRPDLMRVVQEDLQPMLDLFADPQAEIEIAKEELIEALVAFKKLDGGAGSSKPDAASATPA